MNFPQLSVIEEELTQETAGQIALRCAVLRNVTVEGMEPYLRYAARRDGIDLQLHWGDFDNILQEASGGASGIVSAETRVVVVCLWLPAFSELFGFSFARASGDEVNHESERIRDYCSATIRALRGRTTASILWLAFEPPAWPSYGIADSRMQAGHRKTVMDLNIFLASELGAAGNAWLIDTPQCLERVGAREFYDWRFWYMARSPFSRAAMAELSIEIGKHVRALAGKARKCLVLDCDNTLWGGIIGEDGLDGIHIGRERPGCAFRDFQVEILNLYHRGVILALCSKNNEQDVLDVLRSHPEMVLREENFSVMRINWQDKAANLREIASQLNIGLDSILFVDDNEFEINLVRSALPEVETLLLPHDKAATSRLSLSSLGLFDTQSLTDEDRARGQMYRAEVARSTLQSQATDLQSYLQSLQMTLNVRQVDENDLDRAAQLCQRTNQFNLTTRRHTRDDLAAYAQSTEHTLLSLKLSDRFGDYGIVGFCMTAVRGTEAVFDTFLMSCRALGRGVETAFLSICADAAAGKGATTLKGCYIPTRKNAQVSDFYSRHGFTPFAANTDECWFELYWRPGCIAVPDYLQVNFVKETR